MKKFLIADPQHVHARNFRSLFDYLDEEKAHVIVHHDHHDLMGALGDYAPFQTLLAEPYDVLCNLSSEQLFNFSSQNINLFNVARTEILALVITFDDVKEQVLPSDHQSLFNWLFNQHKHTLLLNMAACLYWVRFWSGFLKQENPTAVLVFSGSPIYARALLELLRSHRARPFVLESFFTGHDNYIEEKYEPIANNSNLKYFAYYNALEPELSADERDRERNKAINKILQAKNKNVSQPAPVSAPLFNNGKRTLLIVGQVLNDFSLLEHRQRGLNSIPFYSELIDELLKGTDLNIIFKAHPWERKKKNIHSALTLNTLRGKFHTTTETVYPAERLIFLEDFNLQSLFKQVDFVAAINSQSLIEAAFEGFQPIQFGDAFYGAKGFTSDYSTDAVSTFIDDLKQGRIPGHLGMDEFCQFETFLIRAFQYSLISANPSGKKRLRDLFNPLAPIAVLTPATINRQPTLINNTLESVTRTRPKNKALLETESTTSPGTVARPNKKWLKFLHTPRKFFYDSKNKKIHWLYIIVPNKLRFARKKSPP